MNYIQGNKEAWEEAFEHRHEGWGEENAQRLLTEELPFFQNDMITELKKLEFKNKTVAQFCCNNGRELLSLMQLGVKQGYGFDIAENIIQQARDTADQAGIKNCEFQACSILDIPEAYHNKFDYVLFTIGAITWFEDLNLLFEKTAKCLKPGGLLIIHDFHPIMNSLPMPDEPEFDENHLDRFVYSYFRKEPWIENEGMGYMSKTYTSKTFISFTHTMSAIMNAVSDVGMYVAKLNEYDYDIGLTDVYDGCGLPLSYLLFAKKA